MRWAYRYGERKRVWKEKFRPLIDSGLTQKFPKSYKAQILRRSSRLKINGGSHTFEEWNSLLESSGHTCMGCGKKGEKLYRDHIRPVLKGGSDSILNIQPLCLRCNFLKAAKFPFTFPRLPAP